MKRTLLRLSIPLRRPFVTSNAVVSAREMVLLRLEDTDGTRGYGEAAPFEPYDGVPVERAVEALSGGAGLRPAPARAAEEIARLDLAGRQEVRPLAELRRDSLPVNMTLPAGPPDEVAARAREGLADGYACFKVKVGLPDDAERVAAARGAVGPWPALRVDANRAWSVDEAVQAIRALEQHDLEFVEQPCATLEELAEVRERVSTPIAADESITTIEDVRRAIELGACDVVNLKLAGCGGFGPARDALREARAERPGGLPVQHARRSLGNRRRAAAGGGRGRDHGLRPGHAGPLRRAHCRSAAQAAGRAPGGAPGPGSRSARGPRGARRGAGRGLGR